MESRGIGYEAAYKSLLSTELYQLLQDADTRLFLETNEYLIKAYDIETERGKDKLYEHIKSGT